MVTEKLFNLSEKRVDLPREKESGTISTNSEEHLSK